MSDATKWMLLGAVLAVGVRMGRARGGPRLLVRPLASPGWRARWRRGSGRTTGGDRFVLIEPDYRGHRLEVTARAS